MTGNEFTRWAGAGRGAAPVRLVHLGLGSFFRAHQAWYTDHSSDAAGFGYAAFGGRGDGLADQLGFQDGLYTLVTRASSGDRFEVVSSVSRAHGAGDHAAWLQCFRNAEVCAVTVTVTEAGYLRRADGGLDADRPEVQADLEALRNDAKARVRTAPARLAAGFAARRQADAGPMALVPCDNVAGNGAIAHRVVTGLAKLWDESLADWIGNSVSPVTTVVDRITPHTSPEDVRTVLSATRRNDCCPVVTEPFTEWVLSGDFPAGRPSWQDAGARFADDVTPYEHRKLWLLNGAHSLLAYAGSIRGHATVAEAIDDSACRFWVDQWWDEAAPHLDQPADEVAKYRAALLERFGNERIHHQLAQIAADGSQKLPIRVLPVLRAERAEGRTPEGASRVLAAYFCYLRGLGAPVNDVRADVLVPLVSGPVHTAVARLLSVLDENVGADADVVNAVVSQVQELTSTAGGLRFHQ